MRRQPHFAPQRLSARRALGSSQRRRTPGVRTRPYERQAVICQDTPTPYPALIHEAALRTRFGGTAITGVRLRHLPDMSEREHITVKVIPFAAGGFPGSGQSIFHSRGPVPRLDTVHLDQSHGPAFLDAEAQLDKYRAVLKRVESRALAPEKSRDLIHTIAQDL